VYTLGITSLLNSALPNSIDYRKTRCGVVYLFLRGMKPEQEKQGVFETAFIA